MAVRREDCWVRLGYTRGERPEPSTVHIRSRRSKLRAAGTVIRTVGVLVTGLRNGHEKKKKLTSQDEQEQRGKFCKHCGENGHARKKSKSLRRNFM